MSRAGRSGMSRSDPDELSRQELVNALTGLVARRSQLDARRAGLAGAAAETLVQELVAVAPLRPDCDLEDELCSQLGLRLREWADGPLEDSVSPNLFAEAIVTSAAAAVRAALRELNTEPDGWQAAWRVLMAAAGMVPFPLSAAAVDTIEDLRAASGGQVLPTIAHGPAVTGPVLWTRDAYGSRFGVTTAVYPPTGPDRWYLWDIDACGHQAFTVHSGYYAGAEEALEAWQAGVGEPAAAGTTFTPADDHWLLAELMPAEEGSLQAGGENTDQLAEYHRSRRLAEAALRAVEPSQLQPRQADLEAAAVATQFTAWLRTHRADQPQPTDLEELITELADSWSFSGPAALYSTCSPHRVALTVLHLRNYYQDDFAAKLIGLLPDWTCWLAARNATPPHLAQRCRPYALGEPHPDVGADHSKPNYLARITE